MSQTLSSTSEQHFALLDLNRGLLALWVFAGHAAVYTGTTIAPLPPPGVAVDCFMLLSGFLMSFIFLERQDKEPWSSGATWLKFYLRRFFRIAPVYYLLLAVAFAAAEPLQTLSGSNAEENPRPWSDAEFTDPARTQVDWLNILTHVTFTFGLFPPFASNNALPDWSIGLEMQFYAAFPFLMVVFRRVGYLVPLVLATLVYVNAPALFGQYLESGSLLHFGQPSFLPLKINVFLIGMLLGEARFAIEKPETIGRAYQLILLAVGLCLFHQHNAIRVATVLFILWIVASQKSGPLSFPKIFSWFSGVSQWKIFQFMADTSYAVYLIHLMILTVISAYLPRWAFYASASPQLKCWILLAIAVPVVYTISAVIHQCVEKPGIRFGKKIVARIT